MSKECDVALSVDMDKEPCIAVVELLDQPADMSWLVVSKD
jgi:hypothetical protein